MAPGQGGRVPTRRVATACSKAVQGPSTKRAFSFGGFPPSIAGEKKGQPKVGCKEEAETCSSFSGFDSGTGVDIWESAVRVAQRENPDGVEALLREIGVVNALYEDGQGEIQTKQFVYSGTDVAAPAVCVAD